MTNRPVDSPGQSWGLADRWRNTRPLLAEGARSVAVVALGVAAAGVIGYVWSRQSASTAIAIAGVWLQWGGLAVVALGMVQMRKRFHRPGWFRRVWGALQRPPDITVQASAAMAGWGTGTATAVGSLANPTIEERLTALEAA